MKKLFFALPLLSFLIPSAAQAQCGAYASFVSQTAASNLSGAMNKKFNIQCGSTSPVGVTAGTAGIDGFINTSNGNFYIATASGSPATWQLINPAAASPAFTSKVANYTLTAADFNSGNSFEFNGSSLTATMPASLAGVNSNGVITLCNYNSTSLTVALNGNTIDGGLSSTLAIPGTTSSPQSCKTIGIDPSGSTLITITSGTVGINSSTINIGSQTVANGACSSTLTATLTGLVAGANFFADFASDPTAVTGWNPAAAAQPITIIKYATTNTANIKLCNYTAGSITTGAMTLTVSAIK